MRSVLLIISLTLMLNAASYKFDEYRLVKAVDVKFKKSGAITFDKDKISITYDKPQYQKVTSGKKGVTIDKGDGDIEKLEGRALTYTKVYLDLLRELDNVNNYQENRDFRVEKADNVYTLYPKGEIDFRIEKIVVDTKKDKVKSFKMYMKNQDIIEIVKR